MPGTANRQEFDIVSLAVIVRPRSVISFSFSLYPLRAAAVAGYSVRSVDGGVRDCSF